MQRSFYLSEGRSFAPLKDMTPQVYVAARSEEKARAAIAELKELTGKTDNHVKYLKLDLADLTTIRGSVDDFLKCVTFLLGSFGSHCS